MTILEGLVAEHRVFLMVFDQIEQALPGVKTREEITLVCRILAGLLHNHGEEENDLAYIALDHILKDHNQHARLYHDHQEIDGLLKAVEKTKDLAEARARLKAALDACRAHFNEEERLVFPLIEKALQQETLQVLGRVWKSSPYPSRQPSNVIA
jgi:hemerythrin-like domain-containing protein